MTAAGAPVFSRPQRSWRVAHRLPARLLRLELRRNAMVWTLPLVAALFWFDTYRKTMTFASPPLWSLRTFYVQGGSPLMDCAGFVAGVAAWMGSRDGRRHTTDLVAITARPRWTGRLATWAATTSWATVAYLGCVAVVYGETARQASWGGPLWWPVLVGAAGVAALSALGFAAGAFLPGRFTAPLAAVVAFFALAVGRTAVEHNTTYAQILPVTKPLYIGPEAGVFYPYLPDVSIAQVMFLAGLAAAALGALGLPARSGGRWLRAAAVAVTVAGLLASGTALGLAGTARVEANGVVIPALHDAASDQPNRYIPVCGHGTVPVCLHPAYRAYLPEVTAALGPVLGQVAGLPGAPVRVTQVATSYLIQDGRLATISGSPPVLRLAIAGDVPGAFDVSTADFINQVRSEAAAAIADNVIGGGLGAQGNPGQQAIAAALARVADVPLEDPGAPPSGVAVPGPASGTPVDAAAARFAALPAATRHSWLTTHLAALRAGHITLAQLP